ncbi:MAG: cytochrome c biogenesis protein CcsA [Armatimonadota bacterium]|nr:cytochrome c biogenesis protein CcsA [bacterium]
MPVQIQRQAGLVTITADNFPIYASFLCISISFLMYFALAIVKKPNSPAASLARGTYITSLIAIGYSTLYMLQSILSETRYDIAYIHDYSGPNDALIYKISALWAGQEGSLLIWTLMAGVIGLFLMRRLATVSPIIMSFWCSVQAFFTLLLIVADPFRKMLDYQTGSFGQGLNPLLKNPWMAIHPPIIFLGYAALAVPAAFAIYALIKGNTRDWVKLCLPWALFGWVSLTAGIVLGMVWSYEVLGWGGYWGWDPVENASLIPWLTSTALLHGLLLQRSRNRMARANIVMALGTFVLVLYASFLTRSGVLSNFSVHSFADLGTYSFLLAFLVSYLLLSIALITGRWRAISGTRVEDRNGRLISRDTAITAGVAVLTLFTLVVLIGTSWPLIRQAAVRPQFYTHMSMPLAAAILVLMALGTFAAWSRDNVIRRTLRNRNAHIAHIGVALLILGVVASSMSRLMTLPLKTDGTTHSALGWSFALDRTDRPTDTTEITHIIMRRGSHQIDAPLTVEYTEHGAVRKPFIRSSILGDLYISPKGIDVPTITPTASMTDDGWAALPYNIPGTGSTIRLVGMEVESHMARLEYTPKNGTPVEVTVYEGRPAAVDGYTFTFQRFVSNGSKDMATMTAGVELAVTGRTLAQRVMIEVSWKPLIWLVWAGTALIILGGALAMLRRRSENAGLNYGILPDSAGSDGEIVSDSRRGRDRASKGEVTP